MTTIEPISDESIERAAIALRAGKLVAFPTETVYGLGGDATNDRAVAEIFAAKNRPDFNPLIIHVASKETAETFVHFNETAHKLADRFWPGALTLILNRTPDCAISALASAGLNSLAIRIPGDENARRLIDQADRPIAAPSANASGRLSPTTAQHVSDQLADQISLILDGGACTIGVESTVLDVTGDTPTLLRPGGIDVETIEQVLQGPIAFATSNDTADNTAPKSPGMLASHYAPERPLRMEATSAEPGEALLGFGPSSADVTLNLSETGDLTEAAANLFAFLHRLDTPPHCAIAVAPIPEQGLGLAINDRLRRAATRRPA